MSDLKNETVQPLEAIAPMPSPAPAAQARQEISDPAKLDYKQGREHLEKKEWSEAAVCFHNALLGFEEQRDEQGMANARDRLGDVCMAREDYQTALTHYFAAMALCDKFEDILSWQALNKKVAVCHRRMGKLDQALAVCMEIFDSYGRTRNPEGTVRMLEVMAEIYEEMGDLERAGDSLRTIASIHRNFKHNQQAAEYEQRAVALGA